MAEELRLFFWSVLTHWFSLLTGGAIAVMILLWEHYQNRSIRWRWMVRVMTFALFISCFLAWRELHERVKPREIDWKTAITLRNFLPATTLLYGKPVRPCTVKVSAKDENLYLRNQLVKIITLNDSPCRIVDPDMDAAPDSKDARPGVTVHWDESGQQSGDALVHILHDGGFKVSVDHHLPSGSPPEMFWIQFGSGSPWQDDAKSPS